MIITIPNYRARSRNKTATSHWTVYMTHRNELAELIMAYSPQKSCLSPAVVVIEAYYEGKRHVDTSNIDDKMIIDGLMRAGILRDDTAYENPKVIKVCYPESGVDKLDIEITSV